MSFNFSTYHRGPSVALAEVLRTAAIFHDRFGAEALRNVLQKTAGVRLTAHVAPENRAAVIEVLNQKLQK
jgi:hypothetical protein